MSQLKILILMSYYNRPILLRRSLKSILEANKYHQNWHLSFGDDGSDIPGRPIVEEVLADHLGQISFANSNMSLEDKIREGLVLGKYANEFIRESDADLAIMLCDDDELLPDYLKNLSCYFVENDVLYAYSKVSLFNPLQGNQKDGLNCVGKYNSWDGPIDPVNRVDASQVSWRLLCCKVYGAWFAETPKFVPGKPWTKDTDKSFFENLREKCGLCHPTGFVGQYKGIHDYQLLWNKDVDESNIRSYITFYKKKSGVEF